MHSIYQLWPVQTRQIPQTLLIPATRDQSLLTCAYELLLINKKTLWINCVLSLVPRCKTRLRLTSRDLAGSRLARTPTPRLMTFADWNFQDLGRRSHRQHTAMGIRPYDCRQGQGQLHHPRVCRGWPVLAPC